MGGNAVKKGSYILVVELKEDKQIEVGKLGLLSFRKGYYAYVGSAMGGLDGRIGRHMRKDKKKHWHIDYLLEEGMIRQVWCMEGKRNECMIASEMADVFTGVANFGSSDCRCKSHLFYSESMAKMEKVIEGLGMKRY